MVRRVVQPAHRRTTVSGSCTPTAPEDHAIRRISSLPGAASLGVRQSMVAHAQTAAAARFGAWQRGELAAARPRRTVTTAGMLATGAHAPIPTRPMSPESMKLVQDVAAQMGLPDAKVRVYKTAFDENDEDRDGCISYAGFCGLLLRLRVDSFNTPVTTEELFGRATRDGRGSIEFAEFVQFYQEHFYEQRGVVLYCGRAREPREADD